MTTLNFFDSLNPDTVILTPNRRLSATLHKLYQQHQLSKPKTCWLTPNILPITTWINTLWKNYTDKSFLPSPFLLNTAQEQFLWEKIILNSKNNEQLLQITETAELARSAWTLIKQWEVDIHHPLFESSDDYLGCLYWMKEFTRVCNENNWIDTAVLPQIIIQKISSGKIIPPRSIMTYGFTEYSPQFTQLFSACEITGSQFTTLKPFSQTENIKRISLADNECEIETIARYAKSIHETSPEKKIGCVFPDLDKKRDRIAQVFSEVFAEENSCLIEADKIPYNISAGKSLSQTPVIHAALQILSLHKKNISLEVFGYLLTSPFIGEAEIERINRADYEYQLRFNNKTMIPLSAVVAQKYCPRLVKRLVKVISHFETKDEKTTYAAWANYICEILSLMGWPGERSLNSEEYQMVESWLNLLSEFATLDQVSAPVSYQQALHMIKKMAANKIFQAKSPDSPIQVLGLLEAAGMPFDHVWVSGLNDISFPPQPKPNPFIPKQIQRDLEMPHATANRELNFCNILINQFKESALSVIFSHAEKQDELELQPSPLIRNFPQININDLHQLKKYFHPASRIFASRNIEWIGDEKAPGVSIDEKIHGGVSVIKHQALCPFRSFAEWRLHARAMETPMPGLRTKDRGTIIHKSLELLWNQLKDQATLLSLDEDALDIMIHDAIDQALAATSDSHSELKQYMMLEKKRLHQLISGWLAIEKQRPPFHLLTNEKSLKFTLGPLSLSIRIDRIDQLQDGSKFIVDYKTGKNNDTGNWFSERPEEPQLPLYALLDTTNISAITFAQVYAGEHCFKGVSHYAMDIKGVKLISEIKKSTVLSWPEQLQQWKDILTKLGIDFYNGVANVDPKDGENTCTWCAIKPLCRINENRQE